jgi:uncharacterized protein (TIGR03067 family)
MYKAFMLTDSFRTLIALVIVFYITLGGGECRADDKEDWIKRDKKALDGIWFVDEAYNDGQELTAADRKKGLYALQFEADKNYCKMAYDNNKLGFDGEFRVEPQKDSGVIEFQIRGLFDKKVKEFARYQIKDKKLYVCFDEDSTDRKKVPDKAETKNGDKKRLYIFSAFLK